MRRWAEDKVDSMRQQKDEELEQYKKEIERAKRFESQKAAAGTAMASSVGVDASKGAPVKRKVAAPAQPMQ